MSRRPGLNSLRSHFRRSGGRLKYASHCFSFRVRTKSGRDAGCCSNRRKSFRFAARTRETTFVAGKDFTADIPAASIDLKAGSKIPVTTQEQMYPLMTSNLPKIARQGGDRTRGIFFGEGAVYHNLQVEVTYRFEPGQWKGPTPKYAGESLPKDRGEAAGQAAGHLDALRRQYFGGRQCVVVDQGAARMPRLWRADGAGAGASLRKQGDVYQSRGRRLDLGQWFAAGQGSTGLARRNRTSSSLRSA